MHISQVLDPDGARRVVVRDGAGARFVEGVGSTYNLAQEAIIAGQGLADAIRAHGLGAEVDLAAALDEGRVLVPVAHPDPAHLHLTGTGLTHLGSAAARDAMHQGEPEAMSDSMKMFRMGIDGGKPGTPPGVQPEWFYKGNGTLAVGSGAALMSPAFALDAGEEPEIAGIYLVGPDATPWRLGFALANEFSDHVTERQNYLYLAHSKLRPAAFGPEILLGPLPPHVEGASRVRRGGTVIWEKPFLSGEDNMSHSVANLEYHHFKYPLFREPGDVHVHMFGTATLSVAEVVLCRTGDIFEIEAPQFGLPLRNRLSAAPVAAAAPRMEVRAL
jgi:hypothetical protein